MKYELVRFLWFYPMASTLGNYGGYYDNLEKRAYEDGYDKDAGLSFIDWSARTIADVMSLCPSELWGAE